MPQPDWSRLQTILGFQFRDESLLRLALTHRSYGGEGVARASSNERLEFLGDAVLGLVVAEHLYKHYPEMSEGQMTVLRSSVVRERTLAEAAQRLGLGHYLLIGRGEELSGGRERPRNLARALEALVGAASLDRGLAAARRLILRALREALAADLGSVAPFDPKSRLQELVQARGGPAPVYRTVEGSGPQHAPSFVIEVLVRGAPVARGEGRSKRLAEQEAAAQAYRILSQGG
ncbi:MAG: ribonuclease III [Chloroflexi bacterium]|nr:ribonuclease III [Chloroflexota bacterium]